MNKALMYCFVFNFKIVSNFLAFFLIYTKCKDFSQTFFKVFSLAYLDI